MYYPCLLDGDHGLRSPQEPPKKRSRTATLLDPVAVHKALTEVTIHDEDYIDDDTGQICLDDSTIPSTEMKALSPHVTHDEMQPVGKPRRATYNITPVKSKHTVFDQTFEVADIQPSPADHFEIAPNKDRYVFIHSPPCEVSKYNVVDMELTGATNNSLSSSHDEQNKSQISKSVINHDDRVIKPWGNIQLDKSTATKTNASKSKLPKPKKGLKNETSLSHSTKVCPSKQSKDAKKLSKKSKKKANWMSESFKNDLAVFDLSAGDSFSLPPPQIKQMKPKHNDIMVSIIKDCHKEQADIQSINKEVIITGNQYFSTLIVVKYVFSDLATAELHLTHTLLVHLQHSMHYISSSCICLQTTHNVLLLFRPCAKVC